MRTLIGSTALTLVAITLPAVTATGAGQPAAKPPAGLSPKPSPKSVPKPSATAKPPKIEVAPSEAQARAAATRQGTPVEVAALRSETRTVVAQPNGELNLEISSVPVRAKKGDTWTPVETGLARRADGALVPKSATVELAFSGGGSELPMVSYGKDGKRLALTWPGALPTPKVSGDTATYAEVLPGIDLILKATATGYTQHLVVKTAAAAKNPALDQIRLGLTTKNLAITSTANGGLEARDAKGAIAFTAPPSAMWDAGAGRAVAGVKLAAGSLTLVPDLALLRGPKTVYPVTIDPDWRTYDKTYWTSVVSGNGGTAYPNTSPGGSDVAQVGLCNFSGCNGIGVARSYFQFDTGAWGFLQGKRIMGATLDSAVVHSGNCTDSRHNLYGSSAVGSGTTWNNMPQGPHLSGVDVPRANSTGGCGGWKEVHFPIPASAVGIYGASTYYLVAGSESDSSYWRKYDPAATKLRVRYNTAPGTPQDPATDPVLPAPCKWCEGKTYFSGNTISLKATLSDPDNNAVQPQWDIYTNGVVENRYGGFQASGARHDTTVTLTDGAEMEWFVRAWDTDENNGNRLDAGPWVHGQGPFLVDRTPPSSMPKVSGSLYREDNQWHGGVGVPGTFTVERTEKALPDDGTKDVDHYLWDTVNPPTRRAEANSLGGSATFEFVPTVDGPQDVFVQSVDRAGNRSETKTVHIYVRAGNGALTSYPLNGNTLDEAFLGDRDGTLQGKPKYGPGAVGNALQLDGVNDYFTAPSAARTDNSFSVSAWVKPESATDARGMAIASQQGDRASGFYLNYRGDTKKTTFMLAASDTDNAATAAAQGPALQRGVWTQVTGVYDKPASHLRLYHNGVKVGDTQLAANFTTWNAAGPLTIGREKWNGVVGSPWLGAIDEVQVFDRVLSDAEVRASVGRDNVRTAHWKFDELSGKTARNDVDGSPDLVLSGKAAFTGTTGGALGGALRLPGSDPLDFASGGPVLRTDQSFTAAAWVNLAELPSDGNTRTALSVDGEVNSALYLGHRAADGGKWEAYMPSQDKVAPRPTDAVIRSDVAASLNTWTHLAAVYDAPAHQLRLYVNGKLAGTTAQNNGFNASGPLTIGRGRYEGSQANPWKGLVDDVRAYNRELSEAELAGIVARSNVTVANWKLDGNPGDSSGRTPALTGTLVGTPAWTGGQSNVPADSDLGLKLIGNGAHLSAPSPVPDLRNSFSVAAWAKLDTATGRASVVSQDAGGLSVFNLHASFDNRWAVVMRSCDAAMTCVETRAAGPAPQPGVWTHLAAVYDASAGLLSLYVNGVVAGTQNYRHTGTQSEPTMRVGRATWSNGAGVDPFTGAIDDVSVYNRVLFADEIATMAGRDLTLAHNWRLDEPSGPTASDAVGARTGTLAGPTRVPGRLGNALNFNGTSDAVSTAAVDVDTAKSFTVSSWVKLRELCEPGADQVCHTTAVSLDGGATSKFRLGHVRDTDNNQFGAWTFEMPEADGTVTKASVSATDSDVDQWVHLVGVYDAPARRLWLYVNATRQGDGTLQAAWAASGGLQLGRGRVANAAAEYWPGAIDDVRVYAGALDKSRIESLVASYPKKGGGTPVLPTDAAAQWKFDENQGTAGADSSGHGRTATLKGGSGWISGRQGTGAWFDGTSGYAETAAPVVDTLASFSAGAWAYLTRTDQGSRTVLAQDGNRASGFLLQFNGASGKWAVVVPSADRDNPENNLVLTSAQKAAVGQWVHLGVVYNALEESKPLRLYVNGVLSAAQTGVTLPTATGPTTIGRSKWNGGAADFFPRGVDDVRIFTRALSDGEMRKVHDDVGYPATGFWRFDDDTARDWTSRNNASTVSGVVSYPASPIAGKALQLDGSSAITSQWWGAQPQDSFTVSGWAKLDRTDKIATIAAQDGDQLSTFVLQYRPALGKWVFGAPDRDEDGAKSRYAVANQPAVAGRWTHVAGVHDYAAHQLRLYVNGALAGTLNDVVLADKAGSFSIGRAKVNGVAGDFFTGQLDEVRADLGMVPDTELAQRAGYPRPADGQLGRFVNDATGERYTAITSASVRPGYRYERSLGAPVPAGENTTALIEGGLVYSVRPTNVAVQPVYRCKQGANAFDSLDVACEGGTKLELAGYALAYARMARYYSPTAIDHTTTADNPSAGYRYEGPQGWLTKASGVAGTQPLYSCRDGVDNFLSNQSDCEGKSALGAIGNVWSQAPDGLTSTPVVRCNFNGQRFISLSPTCEGQPVERTLGYTLTALPAVTPTFA
ncbi:LamG-like jellyroll fold domain-containing protein [Kribbella sp. NPDC056861]|uniref:LamG domain-containing protein n=1 Tax=Kribbella sp. NPDC056861 TaxID=3154857 RepID=UPI003425E815